MEKHLHSKLKVRMQYPAPKYIEHHLIYNFPFNRSLKRAISYLIVIFIFFLSTSLNAQSISRSVIGIAGGQNMLEGKSVNWTLGEALVGSFKSSQKTGLLSIGFQQGNIQVIPGPTPKGLQINLSPNPTPGWLNIFIPDVTEEEYTIQLSDMSGRILFPPQKLQKSIKELDLSIYPAGVYLLTVKSKNAVARSFKVVKTDY